MDNHFKLNIGNGEKSYEYDFMQKPIEDLTKKYYVSSSSNISIEYIVDGNDIKFNMMLNHKNMKNAQEYLDTLIFMKSLFDKGLFINSKLITKPGLKDDRYNNRCELISIWKKITDLEKRLGLEFPLDTDVIDKEEYLNICILHKALIENKAVRRNQLIKNFTYNLNELTEDEQKDLKEKKAKIIVWSLVTKLR